ncbi:L-aspartate oxidase [compost metagenome]
MAAAPDLAPEAMRALRMTMSDDVGVVRDAEGLARALAVADRLEREAPNALPLIAARLIAGAALGRRESRGGHYRADWPETAPVARHTRLHRPEAPAAFMAAE